MNTLFAIEHRPRHLPPYEVAWKVAVRSSRPAVFFTYEEARKWVKARRAKFPKQQWRLKLYREGLIEIPEGA